jgi:hypothetical protein
MTGPKARPAERRRARASVYYDTAYLRDVLLFEDVSASLTQDELIGKPVTYSTRARVKINIDEDGLLDDLVTALTKVQQERKATAVRRNVELLTRQRDDAIKSRQARQEDWKRADELEREIHSKLHDAQKALAALTAPDGDDW